jgi:hypothetical protein
LSLAWRSSPQPDRHAAPGEQGLLKGTALAITAALFITAARQAS